MSVYKTPNHINRLQKGFNVKKKKMEKNECVHYESNTQPKQ